MSNKPRSGCPISLGLDIFGDKWTLLIVRDLMFRDKRHFREILTSDEHISSNILTDRLTLLLDEEIITKTQDPSHKQKVIYSLTEKGIDLLPILMKISSWSHKYRPVDDAYAADSQHLSESESDYSEKLMAKLNQIRLKDSVS